MTFRAKVAMVGLSSLAGALLGIAASLGEWTLLTVYVVTGVSIAVLVPVLLVLLTRRPRP